MSKRRLRIIRKVSFLLAAMPLFQQLGWCSTAFNRTAANTLNGAPATYSGVLQNIALLPAELIINALFGGSSTDITGGGGI